MRLPPGLRAISPFLLVLPLTLAAPAGADAIRIVSADDRGVTLRLDLPAYDLAPGRGGRSEVTGTGLALLSEPGRPRLPYASALIAVPPGARVTATVQGAEETRDRVQLVMGDQPGFRDLHDGLGLAPVREEVAPIADGPWPASPVEVGAPFVLRGQTLVAVQIRPFRYDEAAGRLWARRSVTVRLAFSDGASLTPQAPAAEDRHFEPIFKRAVLNYEQGRRWRAAPARGRAPVPTGSLFGQPGRPGQAGVPLASAAFDESAPEVRVRVDTSGVYGLEYTKLAAKGFPAGIPISELSVHRHEFLGVASPPYATVELPIEVEEGASKNGVFDAGDRIVVWVQNWAERSRASVAQRAWGDAEVVYVTHLPGSAGKRIGLRSGWQNATLTPLASYPWHQRWERNFTYMNFPPDTNTDQFHWTDIVEYYSRPDSFLYEFNDFDPSQPVTFALTLQGRKQNTHYTWCDVENGSGVFTNVADSVFWAGIGSRTFAKTLPGAAFSEGRNNRMRTFGRTNLGPPDPLGNEISNVALNYFEATYWRRYRAINGYLACNSGAATGDFEIQADGFASDSIRAYDVSDSLNPVRLTDVVIQNPGTGWTLQLQDNTPGTPRTYAIFGLPKALPATAYGVVTRRQLYAQGSGDYLLVAPEAFLGAATSLGQLRQNEGLNVVVAPLESVNDEFNGGRKSSYALRRFIRYAYDTWGASFVLLMGDGSEDPQHVLNASGVDEIPIQKVFGPVSVYLGDRSANEIVPGDNWYVWAVDTPPAAGSPMLPDLAIGRLPVRSAQEATDVVSKLAAYETVDTTQTWRRRMLIHADDAFSGASTFGGGPGPSSYCYKDYELVFRDLSQATRAVVADSAGLTLCEPELFDMNVYLANEPVDVNNCRPDMYATQTRTRATVTPLLFQRLNDGRLWWNYQGHANASVLEHESIYLKTGDFPGQNDKERFTNDGKPFFFSAFSCHPNAFAGVAEGRIDVGPSIGEDMVTLPGRGAIASWGSVGYEIIPASHTDHLNVTMAQSLFWQPPRDDYLGHGASVVLGEGLVLTLVRNYPAHFSDLFERDVALTYELLGDPATRLTVGAPQLTVTANHLPVSDGIPVYLPGQSDTLLLEAEIVSNAAIDSISLEVGDASTTTILPPSDYTLTPPFPDTGPGGGGGRRFHLTYRTQLSTGASRYTIRSRDRYGVMSKFDVVFPFQTLLRSEGQPLSDGDVVASSANLTLVVKSPLLLNPLTDLALTVDGPSQAFTPNPTTPERQFVLSWTHLPYAPGTHTVTVSAPGQLPSVHHFQVVPSLRLTEILSFPNPFDDERGTRFMFTLLSDAPADLLIRVFTVSGRLVYERTERSLQPGHHELPWDGRDAEGEKLANGIYLYRMVAKGASGSASGLGRLVKLRRPTQAAEPTTP